jgi:hypothetical protein
MKNKKIYKYLQNIMPSCIDIHYIPIYNVYKPKSFQNDRRVFLIRVKFNM